MSATTGIQASVGRGGVNRPADVVRVQALLNANLSKLAPGTAPLAADGKVGPKTIAAIEDFQRRVVKMTRPDGRVDPDGKTFRALTGDTAARSRVSVAVAGWTGKEITRGFELCARTVASTFSGGQSVVVTAARKQDFLDLFNQLATQGDLNEFHMYSHSGMDGPIFSDGQFFPAELNKGALPALTWVPGATAHFYGCNAGLSPWVVSFAVSQQVTVKGSAGFSLFSQMRNEFYPFDDDPDRTPCYLDNYPGMEDLLVKNFGYSKASNIFESWWRKAKTYPEWKEARSKHLPPRPMRVIKPT
jgi:hypothetical protein